MVYYLPISGPANYSVNINGREYAFSGATRFTAGRPSDGNGGGNGEDLGNGGGTLETLCNGNPVLAKPLMARQ
ncbi:hypothetical protein ACT691_17120 [Vibrio metschnikovii]